MDIEDAQSIHLILADVYWVSPLNRHCDYTQIDTTHVLPLSCLWPKLTIFRSPQGAVSKSRV